MVGWAASACWCVSNTMRLTCTFLSFCSKSAIIFALMFESSTLETIWHNVSKFVFPGPTIQLWVMPIRRALHVTAALPFQSAPAAWIFLQTRQVSAKVIPITPSVHHKPKNIELTWSESQFILFDLLTHLQANSSGTMCEGGNGASFVLKISNFTRCHLFFHATFCSLRTSVKIFVILMTPYFTSQLTHIWLIIFSHLKADCNCSSVYCVFVGNELTKTIVVISVSCAKARFWPKYPDEITNCDSCLLALPLLTISPTYSTLLAKISFCFCNACCLHISGMWE